MMIKMAGKKISKRVAVDTGSRVLYSIVVGAFIDYYKGGLDTFWKIAGARGSATALNSVTSGPYGWWQDRWYSWLRTTPETRNAKDIFLTDDSHDYLTREKLSLITSYSKKKGHQFITDMLAFNTFEPVVYGVSNLAGQAFGQLTSQILGTDYDPINIEQAIGGMKTLFYISPFIAPTMRMTMQGARKLFGVKTSAQKAQESIEDVLTVKDVSSNSSI